MTNMPGVIYVVENEDENVPCDFVAHPTLEFFTSDETDYIRADIAEARLQEAVDAANYYIEGLRDVINQRPVRDLCERQAAYEAATKETAK